MISSKTKISFLLLCMFHNSGGDTVLAMTGKPNKKVSKTDPDNRQSFINKDVLSMKIITAAKQNMEQDPELLSEVCQ